MKIIIDQQFQEFLEFNNLELDKILEKAKIPNLLWKEELTLDDEQFHQFQKILSEELSDEQIILLSDVQKIGLFMPIFFVSLSSSNGLQAIRKLSKYKKLIAPVDINVEIQNKEVIISLTDSLKKQKLPRFSLLNEQLVILSILRTGSGLNITPQQVKTPYQYSPAIIGVFGKSPTIVENSNSLVFDLEDLEVPFSTRNNSMRSLIEPELNRQLEELKTSSSFINNLHREIQKAIPSGDYSVNKISHQLGTSTRTLQRKLSDSETTFKAEVQLVQKHMALHFAKNNDLSVDDISYMLGYSETSSFARAFKKWTGITVSQYRKSK